MGQDAHAFGGGVRQFVIGGPHALAPAAIDHGHMLGAQQARLHGGVHRRHAAADHHHMAAHRQPAQIVALAQLGDEIDRVAHALGSLAVRAQRVHPGQPDAQEHRVVFFAQRVQRDLAAQRAGRGAARCRRCA
jgi:hypothetical protein